MAMDYTFIHPPTLDPVIKNHISSLYRTVDIGPESAQAWAAHFAEDAILKKSPNEIKGRENLEKSIAGSWAPLKSRKHIVYKVFPFGDEGGKQEVMLHGRSLNVYKDGTDGTFTWAARLRFKKVADDKVLVERYTIIVDPTPALEE
ncbi:hypothetical protein BP6252_08259 [Coleophoma cylindrospora]|uniref:SnoaL-like domain-containing protein n=1 Tax=Coleophoma cylindrospora TaxID=1849047 RepID=A0A3D8R5C8_9HELO|nr:hypothetical protein BP6252_08259 [Coleophoma cylindrospora]